MVDGNNPFNSCILQTAVASTVKCSESCPESANILWQNVYVFKKTIVNKISLQGHVQVESIVTRCVVLSGLPADLLSSKGKVFLYDQEWT